MYVVEAVIIAKNKICGNTIELHPSSLDTSPHVQRFTYRSGATLLKNHGFTVTQKKGGSFLSGPFSNLFFTGFKPIMKLNMILGNWLSPLASDFYIVAEKN